MILPAAFPPPWAGGWGEDRKGVFAEVVVRGVTMEMRWIPPGRFLMGSPEDEPGRSKDEGPQHGVTLSRGFWLAATPCTQAQWEAVMGSTPSLFKGPDRPVESVSWEDCRAYCAALNKLLPGLEARLPTEAEWEYACRAGTTSAFNDGSACTAPEGDVPALNRLDWYDRDSGGETHMVGQKVANVWWLYDMHGNVWEWCQDLYGSYASESQIDPTGAESGDFRVVRGGGWFFHARICRSAYRFWSHPGFRGDDLGFRLAAGQLPEKNERSEGRGAEEADALGPRDEASAPRPERHALREKSRKAARK